MDDFNNPYSPTAGHTPAELAGRDELIRVAKTSLARVAAGKFAKNAILTGLRGVGKTVLLTRFRREANELNLVCIRIEATEGRSLPSMLIPAMNSTLKSLSLINAAGDVIKTAMKALKGFAGAMSVKYNDVDFGLKFQEEAEHENLDDGLTWIFQLVGQAAKERKKAIAIFIDELHVIPNDQLTSLIKAMHIASQDELPIILMAAGLPSIGAQMGRAKTYAERLFAFPTIEYLSVDDAAAAIIKPARAEGVEFTDEAVNLIIEKTQGYPYFLQEWASCAWNVAERSPITEHDVKLASIQAIHNMDESFFRTRFDQLTNAQKRYLRAMAELGSAPQRSGDIAQELNKRTPEVASLREQLIAKGIIYSPGHGLTAFTVPMFDEFLCRIMPSATPVNEVDEIDDIEDEPEPTIPGPRM